MKAPARPPADRPSDLREACVAEALAIVGEAGLEKLSLREVARRLGVSHQAPYRHFPSRDHILAEMVRRAFDHLAEALTSRPRSGDADADSLAMGQAYIAYAFDNPLHYRLMFGGVLPDPDLHPEMMRSGRRAFLLLRDDLGRVFAAHAAKTGAPPGSIDLDMEALFVWSSLHGLVSLTQTQTMRSLDLGPDVKDRLAAHMLLRIGSALGAAPPAGAPGKDDQT